MLSVTDVEKSYPSANGPVPVLRGVSLSLEAGETLALTGESGSGKSTLLHLIGGLDLVDGGRIEVAGTDLSGLGDKPRADLRRATLGIVFQQFNLIASLPVQDNIAFQARLAGRHDRDWCVHLTDRLGLEGLERRYPEQLSGGQQQRVAIARTLAARPSLILADEPTGNLDEAASANVLALTLELVQETGAAFLMVTHSRELAGRLGRRLHLSSGRLA